jgi:hypothetical protein
VDEATNCESRRRRRLFVWNAVTGLELLPPPPDEPGAT